jgi:hypothetical protein
MIGICNNPQKQAALADMAGIQQTPIVGEWDVGEWHVGEWHEGACPTVYRAYSLKSLFLRLASILRGMAIIIAASLVAALVIFIAFSLGVFVGANYYLWFWY